jgi:hypothetical protein
MEVLGIYPMSVRVELSFPIEELKDILEVYDSVKDHIQPELLNKEAGFERIRQLIDFVESGGRSNA